MSSRLCDRTRFSPMKAVQPRAIHLAPRDCSAVRTNPPCDMLANSGHTTASGTANYLKRARKGMQQGQCRVVPPQPHAASSRVPVAARTFSVTILHLERQSQSQQGFQPSIYIFQVFFELFLAFFRKSLRSWILHCCICEQALPLLLQPSRQLSCGGRPIKSSVLGHVARGRG